MVFLEFGEEEGGGLAGGGEALAGELADGFEVEAVVEAGVPIAVLLAFVEAVGDLVDGGVLAGELHGLEEEAGDAEIVEVDGVGEEHGFGKGGFAEGQFAEDADGAVGEIAAGVIGEEFGGEGGGELGALGEADLAELAGGDGFVLAEGKLECVAGQFEGR